MLHELHPIGRTVYPIPDHIAEHVRKWADMRLMVKPVSDNCFPVESASDIWHALYKYELSEHVQLMSDSPLHYLPSFDDIFAYLAAYLHCYLMADQDGREYILGCSL